MEEKRKKRYMGKTELIKRRHGEIEKWKSGFFLEEKDRLAVYKALQEISEACMDLIAMMLRDNDKIPEDDYTNINKTVKSGLLPNELKPSLDDLNGLRNRIVHEYNGLDDKIAFDAMSGILPGVKKFVEVVEKWIGK
jgi:uncharacterized protein YutE (UPF0331/DUF86 family)